jgi:hypothetical protein
MAELTIEQTFEMAGEWYPAAEALLDEHHVVAVCDDEASRVRFGSHVAIQAEQQTHVEVGQIYGRFVRDLRELAHMLSRGLPLDRTVEPTINDITEALRTHRPQTRHRYLIWHDSDVMAGESPDDFWRAADAMMGVAAEGEYSEEDRLIITRVLFIGGASLLRSPALRGWWADGGGQPLWQVVSGMIAPPVKAVRIVDGRGGEAG